MGYAYQTSGWIRSRHGTILRVSASPSNMLAHLHLNTCHTIVELLLSCLLDSEVLIVLIFSVWLNASYTVSCQQILAKQMEVVITYYMEDIVLAGGKIKIWSTCRVSWQNSQYTVGPIREAPQRTEMVSVRLHMRNQLSPIKVTE